MAPFVNVFRYRFLGSTISDTAKLFYVGFDPTSRSLRLDVSGSTSAISVASGDVWIVNNTSASDSNQAYMFFSNEEIEQGARIDMLASNGSGGWKRSDIWHLRTYNNEAGSAIENMFLRVLADGSVLTAPTMSSQVADGRLLCPEFTV